MFSIFNSWKTTICGIGAIVATCLLPPLGVSAAICSALAATFSGIGLINAKDGNVSGDGAKKP
jgi:hypothetical protein